jgi:hypothetical protein
MLFCEVNSVARWFGLAALVSLGLSASAQQSIQFTKPVDSDPSSKANAFISEDKLHNAPGAFNAPSSLFGGQGSTASFDILPGSPQQVLSTANAEQWQKSLDDQKNWTLLTPEEILGIPTPEKILGITDPNDDPKLSAEERFLRRQERQSEIGASNALHRAEVLLWHNDDQTEIPFHTMDEGARFAGTFESPVPGSPRDLKLLFRQHPDVPDGMNQKSDSVWASPFDSPEPLPKPTPEQLAGMETFRALLVPPAWEKTPPAAGFSTQPAMTPDPNMQAIPAFNPDGQSFTPLENGIGKPMGLMPLPGVTGPLVQTKKTPAPTVQPPPWMQNSLQSGYLPQRQF